MNPISNTAYYCCGIRMEDAKKSRSVCNDHFAARFMDERGRQIFEPFKSEKMPNLSNIARCRRIDDYLLAEIARNNKLKIITIGAGFDTRPYRLAGGNWLEIDEPEIISYKNKCLPTDECPNPLRRISIDFAHASLADVLDQESSREYTAFVIEGVFMYLATDSIKNTINTIQSLFPEHVLYCDLMTNKFFTRFSQSIHAKLVATGGEFTARPEFPEAIFTQYGYKSMERVPMFKYARELGILRDEINMPLFVSWLVLNVFLKDLGGYAVHRLYFANN